MPISGKAKEVNLRLLKKSENNFGQLYDTTCLSNLCSRSPFKVITLGQKETNNTYWEPHTFLLVLGCQ
jgi:hypothetical protein